MYRRAMPIIVVVYLAFALRTPCHAEIVTHRFEGVFNNGGYFPPLGQMAPGTQFSGRFSYDLSAPDQNSDSSIGSYGGSAGSSFAIDIANRYHASQSSLSFLDVWNRPGWSGVPDAVDMYAEAGNGANFGLSLSTPASRNVLVNDQLPALLTTTMWQWRSLTLGFRNTIERPVGSITSLGECPVGPLHVSIVNLDNGRERIVADFVPKGGLTLAQAAALCGVDHFNFRNWVREPDAWQVRVNGTIVKRSGDLYPPGSRGIIDPLPGNGIYALLDPRATMPMEKWQDYPTHGDDALEPYWDDDFVKTEWPITGKLLRFRDSPSSLDTFFTYQQGDYTWFVTELVGVDATGQIIETFEDVPGTNVVWITDQIHNNLGQFSGSIYRSTDDLQEDLPPVVSGGIAIVSAESTIIRGDANGDGIVNRPDVVLLLRRFGSPFMFQSDLDLDGLITIRDLALLQSRLTPVEAQPVPIPEPATAWQLFAFAAIIGFAACHWRRAQNSVCHWLVSTELVAGRQCCRESGDACYVRRPERPSSADRRDRRVMGSNSSNSSNAARPVQLVGLDFGSTTASAIVSIAFFSAERCD